MSDTVPTPVQAANDRCGARRPGWENGPEIGIHRIPCVLEAGHPGDHRNAFGQPWPNPGRDTLAVLLADADHATTAEGRALRAMTQLQAAEAHPQTAGDVAEEIAARIIANVPSLAGKITPSVLVDAIVQLLEEAGQ
ncbi:hypothetical protein [Streptomyces pristinaespiralis]|uniref:hypothetical protein n=1 Tax=Streptomyces pristinaespiralis TaxID=38300 RepID=UPI0033E2DF38